ncbi:MULTISPECIES: hypothetical protein [Bradyrhizobium]|nr:MULTISPECIES: hypothetical protein [Bradyrhizobium]
MSIRNRHIPQKMLTESDSIRRHVDGGAQAEGSRADPMTPDAIG